MTHAPTGSDNSGIAPADARPHAPWRLRGKIVAYLVLFIIALASIWFINRRVDVLADRGEASGVRTGSPAQPALHR